MMKLKKPIIPPKETKDYLSRHEIPQLFECLMTGLMYHRPVDPILYLQDCLEKIRKYGNRGVRWDFFMETRRCILPPLTPGKSVDALTKYQPSPGIDSIQLKMRPQTSVICIIAAPGVFKEKFAEKMLLNYPSFVHIDIGEIVKNCAKIEERKQKSRFKNAFCVMSSGDLAPEEMVFELLIWNLNLYPTCAGFFITGFPRTFQQYEDIKLHVKLGRLTAVILIDVSEDTCLQTLLHDEETNDPIRMVQTANSIRRRICNFKNITLPMCKIIDDDNKLRVINGNVEKEDIEKQMLTVLEFVLSDKSSDPATRPEPGILPDAPVNRTMEKIVGCEGNPRAFEIPRIRPELKDGGRRPQLPTCPIMMLLGGPGSGRTRQSFAVCRAIPGVGHFNVTDLLREKVLNSLVDGSKKDWDVVAKRVHSSEPPLEYDRLIPEYWDIQIDILREEFSKLAYTTNLVIIEGYLNFEDQLTTFNENIGGANLVVLLDCEENTMTQRLARRSLRLRRVEDESHIVNQRVNFFKQVTLPVVRYFDEMGKLVIVPADREADMVTNDLVALIEYYLAKKETQNNNSAVEFSTHELEHFNNMTLERKAASKIQSAFRGYRRRRNGKLIRMDRAATTIQARYRKYKMHRALSSFRVDNKEGKISTNGHLIFLVGPPSCGKEELAGLLCCSTEYKLLHVKNFADEDLSIHTIIGRMVREIQKETNTNSKFIVVGFTLDVENLLWFKSQVSQDVHLVLLEATPDMIIQRHNMRGRYVAGRRQNREIFISKIFHYFRNLEEDVRLLTENRLLKKLITWNSETNVLLNSLCEYVCSISAYNNSTND